MKKVLREWFVSAPWGKIALISWGNPSGEPVLLVHGRQDSVATFIPLLEMLPDNYYYVGFDQPGHGKSDAFPIGVMVSRIHFLTTIDVVLKHLGWNKFIYMGHSMGGELGLYYNAIRPNEITKFVHIDIGPALQNQFRPFSEYFESFYHNYYNNYNKYNIDDRVYTKKQATEAVMKSRGLTKEQAEIILSRNLKRIGDDQYKLSWDKRLKFLAPLNLPNDFSLQLFTTNVPPTLFIQASNIKVVYGKGKEGSIEMISEFRKRIKHFYLINVEGTHDVHVTNPERFSKDICWFLKKEFSVKSRL